METVDVTIFFILAISFGAGIFTGIKFMLFFYDKERNNHTPVLNSNREGKEMFNK